MQRRSNNGEAPENGGTNDPGDRGEDKDILGTAQEDLSADNLRGDDRGCDRDNSELPEKTADDLGDFA